MSIIPIRSEASTRGARMLRTALGPEIAAWLEDVAAIEVMLNPDGRLWIDRLGAGIADTGREMSAADGERIIRLVAHHVGAEVHAKAPRVSAEMPDTGERFERRSARRLRRAALSQKRSCGRARDDQSRRSITGIGASMPFTHPSQSATP